MKCIKCQNEANAICQFCGRAVCLDHIRENKFMTGFSTKTGFWVTLDNAITVKDAVWCGECHPEYYDKKS